MKISGYILFLCVITLSCCAPNEYKGIFAMTKSTASYLSNFAEIFNRIIGYIHYIEFYDISKENKLLFISYGVSLSSISLSNLTITKLISNQGLKLSATDDKMEIESTGLQELIMKGHINLNWEYKFAGFLILKGAYSCDFTTATTNLAFTMNKDYNKNKGTIKTRWDVSNVQITGMGGYASVNDTINNALTKDLSERCGEELSKYGKLIIDSLISEDNLKKMRVTVNAPNSTLHAIKNELTGMDFSLVNDKKELGYMFDSYLYNEETHNSKLLKGNFTPATNNGSDLVLHFSIKGLLDIYTEFLNQYANTSFELNAEKQSTLFGHKFTIGTLIPFYPRLAEQFDSDLELTLLCEAKPFEATGIVLSCRFVLTNNHTIVVLEIERLTRNGKIVMGIFENTIIEIKLSNVDFEDIVIRGNVIPAYAAKQLMFFLTPLNTLFGNDYKIFIDTHSWKFRGGIISDTLIILWYLLT